MFNRTFVPLNKIKQVLAYMAGRFPISLGGNPYRGLDGSGTSNVDLRCSQSVVEHPNTFSHDYWNPLGSTEISSQIEHLASLFSCCGICNSRERAESALVEFGSIPNFFEGSKNRFQKLEINSPILLKHIELMKKSLDFYLRPRVVDPLDLTSYEKIREYLIVLQGHLKNEQTRILFLNAKNQLMADQIVEDGSVDQSAIYTRNIASRALEIGASAIFIVHNHPSGDVTASRQDISITREICAACRLLGIAVHDHIIVGKGDCFSLRANGLM